MTETNEKPPKRPLRFRKLSRAQDVRRAAMRIANAILAGDLEPRAANAAVYALHLVQRSLEAELLEKRLDSLEARAEVAQPRLRSVS
jgi:hypothetical protein